MKRQFLRFILTVLFIFSGAVAAYSHCAPADQHFDSGTGHKVPSIHCPAVTLSSNTVVSTFTRSYATDFGKALVHLASQTNTDLAIARFRERTFVKPFFQRDL